MSSSIRVLKTPEEIKIFTDPYRMEIIKAYGASDKPLTVTQVANNMGEVPAKVHYHLKKLLSIEILKLDHIEIIKGINAKYYRLVTDSFKLEVDETAPEKAEKSAKKITTFVFAELDAFKDEIEELSKLRNVGPDRPAKGLFGRRDIYLSDDEFIELQAVVKDYILSRTVKVEGKKRYTGIIGAFRKE